MKIQNKIILFLVAFLLIIPCESVCCKDSLPDFRHLRIKKLPTGNFNTLKSFRP